MLLKLSFINLFVLFLSCFVGAVFYFGLRYTDIPAAHLGLYLLPGFILIFFVSYGSVRPSVVEGLGIGSSAVLLFFLGAFMESSSGIKVSFSGFFTVFIILGSYLFARSIVATSVAFWFCFFMFALVAAPSLFYVLNGEAYLLRSFFRNSSENIVSSWLILSSAAMMSCSLSKLKYLKYIVVASFFVSFVVAFFLFTRASIAVSCAFLLFSLLFYFGRFWLLFVVVFLMAIIFVYNDYFLDLVISAFSETKFSSSGLDSPRWDMLTAYLREISVISLFLGMDLEKVSLISEYSGNPHNSLVRFHSFFGVLPIVFGFVFLVLCFRLKDISYYIIVFLMVVRAFTDVMLFGMFYDIFLFVVIVNLFVGKRFFSRSRDVAL